MNLFKRFIEKINPKKPDKIEVPVQEQPLEEPKAIKKKHETWVLTDLEKMEVLKRVACHESSTSIIKWLKETSGKTVKISSIAHYRDSEKYRPMIERYRAEFERNLMNVPISSKHIRLKRSEKIYKLAMQKEDLRVASKELESARAEIEGKKGDITIQFNQFVDLTDDELLQKKLKAIETIERSRKTSLEITATEVE